METETRKLFIGGISWETSEERLRDYFQTFGKVVEAVIMKDRNTGRARGFGFVVFADASVAERVVRERHAIDGRIVEAKKAVPRDDHQNFNRSSGSTQGSPGPTRTKKIFVGGLPSSITEGDFKRYFDQFGTITDVVVMYDHNTQRPRGFGFITYDTEESVDRVLVKSFHELHGKMVEVKRAVPKELSPVPTTRSYGMNRVNSLLSAYAQGHNPMSPGHYGMRIDGLYSPVSNDRGGFSPYGLGGFNMGLKFDSGLALNDGNGDSYSYFSSSPSRFGSPMSNDHGNGRNVSLPNAITTNGNMWGNVSFNYTTNSQTSNAYTSHRIENHGIANNLGTIGEIWGRSPVSARNEGYGSLSIGSIVYNENNFGSRQVQYRNNEGNIGSNSTYDIINNHVRDKQMENLFEGDSYYMNHPWQSLPNELDVSANIASNNPAGFVGDYIVTAR